MRIVFFTKLLTLGRVAGVVLELAGRGHDVVVATPARERERDLPGALAEAGGVRLEEYEELGSDRARAAASLLRRTRDYVWYLRPEHEIATFNRRRAFERMVKAASKNRGALPHVPDRPPLQPEVQVELETLLARLERELSPDEQLVRRLDALAPDAIVVTPLIRPGLHQAELVKAARTLGIPSVHPVYSWDSLSNKGHVHEVPDRVYAWNDIHQREAVELHGAEPANVVVTGAPHLDAFFELEPSLTRAQLCAQHGFDPARPLVLYLGSTRTVCRDEPDVVARWLDGLRAAPGTRDANVLVRPHPGEAGTAAWNEWRPAHERLALSTRSDKSGQGLFDELHHADAAVGLNTSAQIEAAIAGTPVYTFAAGDAAPGQAGSLHFHHLLDERGGAVRSARTLAEHAARLRRGLEGEFDAAELRRFCERIVRPLGLDRPVAPVVAAEIEGLARATRPVPDAAGAPA